MSQTLAELPSNRKFGFFFFAVFLIAGAYLFIIEARTVSYTLLGISLLFLNITLVKPDLLLPLNKLWMRFGFLLGVIVSPIVLGIIFFGMFTPISYCMKMFGRDELRLQLQHRHSYWKLKDTNDVSPDTFKYQF